MLPSGIEVAISSGDGRLWMSQDTPMPCAEGLPVAYGLSFSGPLVTERFRALLLSDPGPWPSVRLDFDTVRLPHANEVLGEDSATLRCLFGGHLVAEREAMLATFRGTDEGPDPHVLAHPGLAGVAVIFARWLGRSAFHGGAVLSDLGAWGIVGDKGMGKTTTLAALALTGRHVLADDLVVLDDRMVLTGPRTLDLRPAAAERLEGDFTVVTVRGGERRRLVLGPAAVAAPLRGWICLGVGPSVALERIPPSQRLAALAEHLAVRVVPRDPVAFLELASLPAYRLTRPLSWDALPAAVAAIEDLIGGDRPAGGGLAPGAAP